MQLTPPTRLMFYISVVLVVVGILANFNILLGSLNAYALWLVLVGYVVLFLGNTMKGM